MRLLRALVRVRNTNLAGTLDSTFQTGRNICASATSLDRSAEQDRSCRLQGMS